MRCSGVIHMSAEDLYPIVLYARKIGKNTAEFTAADMANFMKWWMKQPMREDMVKKLKERQKRATRVGQYVQQEKAMAKKHTTASFQAAQTSRLAERGIESPINDGEEEIVIHEDTEIVADMGLTRTDVAALLFAINMVFQDYEMEGHEYGASLLSLKEGLEGV